MEKLTERVADIVEKALEGNGLDFDEMEYLYGIELDAEKRLRTIENPQKAGLPISTCVEPVDPENDAHELAEASRVCTSYPVLSAGVGRRITVSGTLMN